jgi:hypothetical protein
VVGVCRAAAAGYVGLADVAHEGVPDVCEALLVQTVFLDGIVHEIEGSMADEVGGPRVAREEREAGLPCGGIGPELVQVFEGLAAQLLARRRVRGDLDGIFDLDTVLLVWCP